MPNGFHMIKNFYKNLSDVDVKQQINLQEPDIIFCHFVIYRICQNYQFQGFYFNIKLN